MQRTDIEFDEVISLCRDLFEKKMKDYGLAWRVLRISSINDLIYIKIKRIRTLQESFMEAKVDESELDGFMAIVNYSLIALIQLEKGFLEKEMDEDPAVILALYDKYIQEAKNLMSKKNHDYGEAWRDMKVSSMTDFIYQKVLRIKQIENNLGKTIVSEGLSANYLDILNYAVFSLIKLNETS